MELARSGKSKRIHLNTEECDELGRGADATCVLRRTQSLPCTPNRALQPRTPTKKPKLESPSKNQKSLNDFYRVTGVVSSSPQKSGQPGSSTHAVGLNGGTSPSPRAEKSADRQLRDPEDEDDISLLACLAKEHPETEAGLMKMGKVEEEEIDYLEGITSEMFDDIMFEPGGGGHTVAARDSTNQGTGGIILEEEEVDGAEPLPDAHYGLLGSSNKSLQEPQGCMGDLPEEVLWQILLLLPAQDLYRCIVRVCHAWRNIIRDPKFVPHKKQYFRYTMREKDTVSKIQSTLQAGGILDQSSPQESVRRLILLMAQHTPGERLRPEDLMRCIQGHRLFPVAKSCLTLRFPDLAQLDPNPYAAMALILVLSEAVTDVQALVGWLGGCMTHGTVVEFLSHMATYLLAMMRNGVRISNRIHYNIFYVLYLMHSCSTSVSAGPDRERFQVTYEQQQILSHHIQPDHVVKIMAFAGTGKTTALVRYAQNRPQLRFLYVAFNKSVAIEAGQRFPPNVACKTVHSIAYNDIGKSYHMRKKLAFNLKVFSVAKVLPVGRGGYVHGKIVTTTLNAFLASADRTIANHHVPYSFKNQQGKTQVLEDSKKMDYVRDCDEIWSKMKDLNERSKDGFHMTHDGYLKLWQLQEPKPCLSDQYDVIFIDEAQDCTPAIMDVLLSQRCAKVLVGDPHQQIYTFRGAVNALHTAPHTHLFYLTQSFRFGPEIAYVGATLLQVCKKVQKILVGGNQSGSVYGEDFDPVTLVSLAASPAPGGTVAVLSRCNFGVFSEAVRLTDRNPLCRIYFVGGIFGIGLSKILDIWMLKQPQHSRKGNEDGEEELSVVCGDGVQAGLLAGDCLVIDIRDGFIRSFGGFDSLQAYALQSEDRELEAKLAVVEKYGQRVPELVHRLTTCHQEQPGLADYILGTVHKAKGLEFDTVMLCDDFARVPCARHHLSELSGFSWRDIPQDECNLLYVAVTRAKRTLVLTRNIRNILTQAGEYFLRSELSCPLQPDGLPPRCSVPLCLQHVSPRASFTMSKRPMTFMDGASPGGPLCERCVWKRVGPVAFLMSDEAAPPPVPERQDLPINMLLLLF